MMLTTMIKVLGGPIPRVAPRNNHLYPFETVRFPSPDSKIPSDATTKSYRYWTLVPDQATSDPKKSPDDPLLTVKNTLTSNRDTDDAAFAEPTGGAKSSKNATEVGQNHASASSNGQESRRLNDSAV